MFYSLYNSIINAHPSTLILGSVVTIGGGYLAYRWLRQGSLTENLSTSAAVIPAKKLTMLGRIINAISYK